MKPRITVLTIGVDGLGLPTKGIVGQQFEHGAVVFFNPAPHASSSIAAAGWTSDA